MGEGELKKRIWSIIPKKQGLTGYSPFRTICETEINLIVDEAKKDFPNFEGDSFLYAVGSEEAIKWFKKWFGDSE